MKRITLPLLLLITVVITILSCTKDVTTTDIYTTDTSKLGLLTQKQWEFDTLYFNYTGPATGTLEYARGGGSNLINEDNSIAIYWKDGTEMFIDNSGNYNPGTWSIAGADSTNLIQTGGRGKILKLDATHFTFFDSTNHILNVQVYKP